MEDEFELFYQSGEADCGITCLEMVGQFYGVRWNRLKIRQSLTYDFDGMTVTELKALAIKLGFRAVSVKISHLCDLLRVPVPSILYLNSKHFVVLYNIEYLGITTPNIHTPLSDMSVQPIYRYHLADPAAGRNAISGEELTNRWMLSEQYQLQFGVAILIELVTTKSQS